MPKAYWHDLIFTMPDIANIEVTNKIGVIDNEINKYRYDVMITVDKTSHTLHNKTIYNKKPVKIFMEKKRFTINKAVLLSRRFICLIIVVQ